MVVICTGTSVVDLRYHWTRQKRLQGSHGTNDEQAYAYNDLVRSGAIDPAMSRVLPFEDIPARTRRWPTARTAWATRRSSSARSAQAWAGRHSPAPTGPQWPGSRNP